MGKGLWPFEPYAFRVAALIAMILVCLALVARVRQIG
jgi:hypothetical protein